MVEGWPHRTASMIASRVVSQSLRIASRMNSSKSLLTFSLSSLVVKKETMSFLLAPSSSSPASLIFGSSLEASAQ